ncbi:NlpC/P60 family protein [Agreia sp. COWG]|uniref:NlpC/P60 family protein n=1 Tax=Agreia sp. COWG TaxID=2773266 RepID=UPI0019286AEB|nr:NlpC/P60 family protein [Agreia sp. COWG]CAD6007059.1 NLPC_P60 domain-containing protein [Agreia sp. COWG]
MGGRHSGTPAALARARQHRVTFQAPSDAAVAEAARISNPSPRAQGTTTSSRRTIRNVARAGVFLVAVSVAGVTALPAYAMTPTGTNPVASTVNGGGTFVDGAATTAQTLSVGADPAVTVSALTASRDSYSATDPAALKAAAEAQAAAAAQAAEDAEASTRLASSSSSSTTSTAKTFAAPQGGYSGEAVVAYAEQFVGVVPYGWGADPNDSFGCDGLTQYVFGQFGISLPRGVDKQAALATRISQSEAVAGDLVVWPGEHIGIYDGAGGIVHSPDFGRYVEHAHSLWGSPVFYRL